MGPGRLSGEARYGIHRRSERTPDGCKSRIGFMNSCFRANQPKQALTTAGLTAFGGTNTNSNPMDNKRLSLTIQIVLDALMVICCIVYAALDKQIHPVVCLLWVLIALVAHIENYQDC